MSSASPSSATKLRVGRALTSLAGGNLKPRTFTARFLENKSLGPAMVGKPTCDFGFEVYGHHGRGNTDFQGAWRRGSESNRRIRLLQSPALPLGYPARSLTQDKDVS